jgi:hypothetical protein
LSTILRCTILLLLLLLLLLLVRWWLLGLRVLLVMVELLGSWCRRPIGVVGVNDLAVAESVIL